MSVDLNHIIVYARDKWASAEFLAGILGLKAGPLWAHFVPVRTANGVTIDFTESANIRSQHCAFLVSEVEFDAALARLKSSGARFYAEFDGTGQGETNALYGGHGVYFNDANGHVFELITQPYGKTPEQWIDGGAVKAAH
jgi:catechol 2,3-dioxygenase-like lactoylglutathione lyase family enzyme